jgi:hypothetical protein
MSRFLRTSAKWLAASVAAGAAAYGAYAVTAWNKYGAAAAPNADENDSMLDRFMPAYEVVERHHIRVGAPAAVTLAAARDVDFQSSAIVRTIVRAREVLLGAEPDNRLRPRGLLAEVQSLGWGVLAEVPGREVVVGAVTKPWEANVTFRSLPPDRFATFDEPGYVKIAWTIRADPLSETESLFRTETRAIATDAAARTKFRRYWSLLSPGIIVIRWALLGPVRKEAERRARDGGDAVQATPRAGRS